MKNICPKCGFECNSNDKFCSQCGTKLRIGNEIDIKSEIAQFEVKEKINLKKASKSSFRAQNAKKIFNSSYMSAVIFLIVLLCVLSIVLFIILDKHQTQKASLQYKNLMENPSQIPLLKEPSSYSELVSNLSDVENFLLMYLKNSNDDIEKKNQVFSSYLTQIDKLPNVLNVGFQKGTIPECSNCENTSSCTIKLNKKFEKVGVNAFNYGSNIVLYPDYKYIYETFGKYVSSEFRKYIQLKSKYNYPVSFDLELNIQPKKLADKIADFEKLYLTARNEYVKEELEKTIYKDFRKFIFTPSIYSTITQEMKIEYKNAYIYFIKNKKSSNLTALIMSYMDKKRAYGEQNFENDYPYQKYSAESVDEAFKNSVLDDVFVQLRKNIFSNKNSNLPLAFVYDLKTLKWKKYDKNNQLESGQYAISEPDENNNISIYNHMFSPIQELNILKYSKLYLLSDGLYAFNQDKLSLYKVTFNGKTFNLYMLNAVDITSLFPGVEVINIDTFTSYNVLIEKVNAKANYIVISRYSQGWRDYFLAPVKGEYNQLALPNMFSVNSLSDVIIMFGTNQNQNSEFSENKPAYKFIIRTLGHQEPKAESEIYTQFDEKTQSDAMNSINHKANIMPKLIEEKPELEEKALSGVPEHNIAPPNEID